MSLAARLLKRLLDKDLILVDGELRTVARPEQRLTSDPARTPRYASDPQTPVHLGTRALSSPEAQQMLEQRQPPPL